MQPVTETEPAIEIDASSIPVPAIMIDRISAIGLSELKKVQRNKVSFYQAPEMSNVRAMSKWQLLSKLPNNNHF